MSWISSNSRTFSIAITAWSANVVSSSICLSVKGRDLVFHRPIVPRGTPSRSKGTASTVRKPINSCAWGKLYSGSARTSAIWHGVALKQGAPCRGSPARANRGALPELQISGRRIVGSGGTTAFAIVAENHAVIGAANADGILEQRLEDALEVEHSIRLMVLSTSAVAVCCRSDSLSSSVRTCTSSNSRTFSIAITA